MYILVSITKTISERDSAYFAIPTQEVIIAKSLVCGVMVNDIKIAEWELIKHFPSITTNKDFGEIKW